MKEFLPWDWNSYNGVGGMADYYRCNGIGLVGDYEHSVMVTPMGPVDRYATNTAKSMKASLRAAVVPEGESGYVQKTMLSVFSESKDPDGPRVGQTALHISTAGIAHLGTLGLNATASSAVTISFVDTNSTPLLLSTFSFRAITFEGK